MQVDAVDLPIVVPQNFDHRDRLGILFDDDLRQQIEDQHEFIALFKATSKSAKKLKAEIARLHPYEVPEIVELKMSNVSKPYLSWLDAESTYRVAKKRHNASK